MSYALNQIRELKKANANVPTSLEYDAALEVITEGWDFDATVQTAKLWLADEDMLTLKQLHHDENFETPIEELAKYIVSQCVSKVADKIKEGRKDFAAELRNVNNKISYLLRGINKDIVI